MNRLKILGIIFSFVIFLSCNHDDGSSQELDALKLDQLYSEIEKIANSVTCTNSTEWTFTSYGSKACGGPVGYIAYSKNIDTVLFLKKIEALRIAQQKYNEKWGIMSDCSIPQEPSGVACENGIAVLQY